MRDQPSSKRLIGPLGLFLATCISSISGAQNPQNLIQNGSFDFNTSPWGTELTSQIAWNNWDVTPGCAGSALVTGAHVYSNCFPVIGGEALEIEFAYSGNTNTANTVMVLRMSSDSGCTDSVNSELVGVTAAAGQFSYLLEVHPDAAFASLRFRDFTTETLFILIDDVYVGPPEPEGVFFDDFESGSDCRWAP